MDDWLSGNLDGSDATPELRRAVPRLEFGTVNDRQKSLDFVRSGFTGIGRGAEDVLLSASVGHGDDLAAVFRRRRERREDFAPMDVDDFRCAHASEFISFPCHCKNYFQESSLLFSPPLVFSLPAR